MVERMFVGEEKQSLERLKEEARVAKELQLTPVWPSAVKTEPVEPAAAVQQQPVNGLPEEPKNAKVKTTAAGYLETVFF